jgi:hypothetical protein
MADSPTCVVAWANPQSLSIWPMTSPASTLCCRLISVHNAWIITASRPMPIANPFNLKDEFIWCERQTPKLLRKPKQRLVPQDRIELSTYPLPSF